MQGSNMFHWCVLAMVVFSSSGFTRATFSWSNCSPAGSPVEITKVELSPDPIVLPGEVQFKVQGSTSAALRSASVRMEVFSVDDDGSETDVPCLLNIGSCTYDDTCTLIETMIEENYAGVTGDIGRQVKAIMLDAGIDPAACPQPAQSIDLASSISLTDLPSIMSLIDIDGDYHAKVHIIDNASKEEVICIEARVSMAAECHGIACIFGKK